MGVIDRLKVNINYGLETDSEEENSFERNLELADSSKDDITDQTPVQRPPGKKKVAKDVFKGHNSVSETCPPKLELSIGDLREKLNAIRNKTSTDSPTSLKAKSPSNHASTPLSKKENDKKWIGAKTNGVSKITDGSNKL